jgi:hypothetical protein
MNESGVEMVYAGAGDGHGASPEFADGVSGKD